MEEKLRQEDGFVTIQINTALKQIIGLADKDYGFVTIQINTALKLK